MKSWIVILPIALTITLTLFWWSGRALRDYTLALEQEIRESQSRIEYFKKKLIDYSSEISKSKAQIASLEEEIKKRDEEIFETKRRYLELLDKVKRMSEGDVEKRTKEILKTDDIFTTKTGLVLGWKEGAKTNLSLLLLGEQAKRENIKLREVLILKDEEIKNYKVIVSNCELKNKSYEEIIKENERIISDQIKIIKAKEQDLIRQLLYGVVIGGVSGFLIAKIIR